MIEKIFKRDDGSRVKIKCNWHEINTIGFDNNQINYDFEVFYCPHKKKVFIDTLDREDYEYRRLDIKEKKKWKLKKALEYVNHREIYEVMLELWESLKPQRIKPE